jgi:hypothetical protein
LNVERPRWLLGPGNAPTAFLRSAFSPDHSLPAELHRALAHFESAKPHLRLKGTTMARELIDTGTDKRYVRRDEEGRFKESDDVGRSSATDQKRDSKTKPKRGEGDKGDR